MNQTAPLGHNNPPSELELLQERLQDTYAPLLEVVDKRLANAAKVPKTCDSDATAQKITDMISLLNKARQELERTHKKEKAPFWDGGKLVDNFFNRVIDKIKIAARDADKPLTKFNQEKVEKIRKEAAERAEQERIEAEKHANAAVALESEGMHAAAGVAFAEAEAYDRRADEADAVQTAKPSELVQTRTKSGAVASLRLKWKGEVENRNALDKEALWPFIHIDALNKALQNWMDTTGGREMAGAKIYESAKTGVR